MQTGSGSTAARLPMVVTLVAILLAVLGIGVVLSGAAKKSSKNVASGTTSTTTTEVPTTLLPGQTTPTTLPGATTTTLSATGTTVKSTTATTTAAAASSCPTPPAATADPGPQQPPALGTYTYASCDSSETNTLKVAAGNSSNGVTRRQVTLNAGGGPDQTATEAYGSSGVLQESLDINTGTGGDIKCDWNPDILLYPPAMSVGKTWTADSKCTTQFGVLHFTLTAKISGRIQQTVGGTAVNAWVIDAHVVLETPQGNLDVTESDYYDPTRGLALYRHSESKTPQGPVTRSDRLTSLTPK